MRYIRTVEISFRDLVGHAFRSALTALGVVFGVGAVVGMMAISEGAKRESIANIEALGVDNIVLYSKRPVAGSMVSKTNRWSPLEYGIQLRDMEHIESRFENIDMVVPIRDTRKWISVHGEKTDVMTVATLPEFMKVTRCQSYDSRGRFLTDTDGEKSLMVCVLGRNAARKIFLYEDPLGRDVRVGTKYFRVVGVIQNPNEIKLGGRYPINNMVFIHFNTSNVIFGTTSVKTSAGSTEKSRVFTDYLYIRVKDKDQIVNTSQRLRTYMKATHNEKDWEVEVPFELLKQKKRQQRIFTIVMASIASISLLVGGIGIMNIMMANIYERTKEIGTRRALGAKKRDVLLQFLTEAVLLTVIGGLSGVAVGVGIAYGVSYFSKMPTAVTFWSVALSVGVSVLIGIVFGTYPAWKAANLDPITALRKE